MTARRKIRGGGGGGWYNRGASSDHGKEVPVLIQGKSIRFVTAACLLASKMTHSML